MKMKPAIEVAGDKRIAFQLFAISVAMQVFALLSMLPILYYAICTLLFIVGVFYYLRFKLYADGTDKRQRIIDALREGPKYGKDLVELGLLRRSTCYVFLGKMEEEGLIEGREDASGRRVYRYISAHEPWVPGGQKGV